VTIRITTFVLGILVFGVRLAMAQATGVVSGRVVDQTSAPLPGVAIDAGTDAGEWTTVTNSNGEYRFTAIAAGSAELTFRLINYTVNRQQVAVTAGTALSINVVMLLALSADVVVTGQSTFRNVADAQDPAGNLLGIAASASQGAITAAQLEARPVMRPAEVLETVPGLIITQHSGEGKANQYYLRGFNLDHGTDFSTTVAGVPVNTPTGAHAHGYADATFLIPELVSGVQFKKGPYFADEGDFSAAGAANINYVNSLDRPIVNVGAGEDGWGRLFAAGSPRVGKGHLLAAVELNHNDGPWDRPDDYRKVNGVMRFSQGTAQNGFSVTGMGYWAGWDATDQVPARAIEGGAISRFGLIDPSDRGEADRQSVVADLQRSVGPGSLRAAAYVMRNSLNLFSNFTYFLDDPVNGDQFEQAEKRIATGGRATYRQLGHLFGRHVESSAGLQVRHDALSPVGLYRTIGGQRTSATREDEVGQTMTGLFAQSEIEWTPKFRTTFGLRADVYQFSVTSDLAANSGSGADTMASPKFGAVLSPWVGTELYVNAGTGYHTNDARGAVTTIDPASGDPADPVTPFVRAKGAEFGLRTVKIRGLQSTVSLWYLGIDSELLFVGDAGTTEPGRPSRRMGIEWSNYWRVRPWLNADLDLSISSAEFTDDDPAGHLIPGAIDRVISGGLTVEPSKPLFGSIRLRHFGPRPLIEDGSVRSEATTLWNGEAGYRLSPKVRLVLEAFNLFDADASDADYYYGSRLPGEAAGGVDDVHTHPVIPRTFRFGLHVSF
jgi:hypothetical protein